VVTGGDTETGSTGQDEEGQQAQPRRIDGKGDKDKAAIRTEQERLDAKAAEEARQRDDPRASRVSKAAPAKEPNKMPTPSVPMAAPTEEKGEKGSAAASPKKKASPLPKNLPAATRKSALPALPAAAPTL